MINIKEDELRKEVNSINESLAALKQEVKDGKRTKENAMEILQPKLEQAVDYMNSFEDSDNIERIYAEEIVESIKNTMNSLNNKVTNVNESWFKRNKKAILITTGAVVIASAITGLVAHNILTKRAEKAEAEAKAKAQVEAELLQAQLEAENAKKALEEAKALEAAALAAQESEYQSSLENTIVNFTYEDITKFMEQFKEELISKGYAFDDKEITATVFMMTLTHLDENVTKELIEKGIINEDFVDLFMNFIHVRNEINNGMIKYEKLTTKEKAELTFEETDEYFMDITGAISDEDELSKAQAKVIFESVKTMYTSSDKAVVKAEVDKFFNFYYNNDPRIEGNNSYEVTYNGVTTEFTKSEVDTIVDKVVYLYWPNVAVKAGQMGICQDIIDDAEYNISIITNFVKEARYLGFNCNENEFDFDDEKEFNCNKKSTSSKKTSTNKTTTVVAPVAPVVPSYGVGTIIDSTGTSTTTVISEGPGYRVEQEVHNDYVTTQNPVTPAPGTITEEIIPPADNSEEIIINEGIVPDATDTYYEEAEDVFCIESESVEMETAESVNSIDLDVKVLIKR